MPEHSGLLPRDLALWNRGRSYNSNDLNRLGLDQARNLVCVSPTLDWRAITDDFSEADLLYVRSVIDEKLRKLGAMQRKALIRRK